MKKLVLLFFIFFPVLAIAASPTKIETKIIDNTNYYASLTALYVSPFKSGDKAYDKSKSSFQNYTANSSAPGIKYRVAVINSLFNSSVYIEEITCGTKDGCDKIKSIQELDLNDFKKKFNFKGWHRFEVRGWDNFNTFIFSTHNRTFRATINGANNIEVAPMSS